MEVSEGTECANSISENNTEVKMDIREETKHAISENTEEKWRVKKETENMLSETIKSRQST